MKFNITIEIPDEFFLLQAALKGNVTSSTGSENGLMGLLQGILQNANLNLTQSSAANVQSSKIEEEPQKEVQKDMKDVDTTALSDFLGFLDGDDY